MSSTEYPQPIEILWCHGEPEDSEQPGQGHPPTGVLPGGYVAGSDDPLEWQPAADHAKEMK